MFIITKTKGKVYKTDSPEKAMEAYRNKNSMGLWNDNNPIRHKGIHTTEVSQRMTWQYLERS